MRNDPETLRRIYIPTASGQQIPLGDLVTIRYEQGAQSIKSEDGFLVGYVLFDREEEYSEVEVVNNAQRYLQSQIEAGTLEVPAGVSYRFAGNYEQQVRASKRLGIVVPIALAIILIILYFQFKSIMISAMVFTGVFIAFAGGFIMIGLYDTSWFLNFEFLGTNMRDLFQIHTINLSVAVWVGFLALFGIATDDGVLVATFLQDSFKKNKPTSIHRIRDAVVEGGLRRVRPAMMTTATTILALLPILTSTGRGADIMLPMAIPSFGGMTLQIITMFTVPVLYSLWQEWSFRFDNGFKLKKGLTSLSIIGLISVISFTSSTAQSIDDLMNVAVAENLELKILQQEYEAALHKAPQVSQLPDPEIGLGAFPLPVETRLGAQVLRIGVTQMIPWKGVLDNKADLENAKASALFEKIGAKQRDIFYDIKTSYWQLYEINESQSIIGRSIDLFETLERLALAKVESGKTTAADVLRVQLKTEELKQELAILETQKTNPTTSINQLLNRPLETPITTMDSLSFAILPFAKDTLQDNIQAHHPTLRMFQLQQEVSKKAITLNDLDGKPSLGFGLDYIVVDPRGDADPARNGRDILQLRGSIKIPINRKKYGAKQIEENLKIAALENKSTNALSLFTATIEKAYADHHVAQLKMELYEKQKEITQAAIHILESEYSSKGKDVDELIRLEKDLLEYELKILKAIVQSHLTKCRIEKFINH